MVLTCESELSDISSSSVARDVSLSIEIGAAQGLCFWINIQSYLDRITTIFHSVSLKDKQSQPVFKMDQFNKFKFTPIYTRLIMSDSLNSLNEFAEFISLSLRENPIIPVKFIRPSERHLPHNRSASAQCRRWGRCKRGRRSDRWWTGRPDPVRAAGAASPPRSNPWCTSWSSGTAALKMRNRKVCTIAMLSFSRVTSGWYIYV